MDIVESDGQGIIGKIAAAVAEGNGLLVDRRDEWDITADYIRSEDISVCPTCRQYEALELAIGGNGFSEYRCSNCGVQVRYEED